MIHKSSIENIYQEYLPLDHLPADRLVFPPSWIKYLESELTNPAQPDRFQPKKAGGREPLPSCCFVCADEATADLVADWINKKAQIDHVKVWECQDGIQNPGDLAGMVTQIADRDLCVVRDENGVMGPQLIVCLKSIVQDGCLEIVIDQEANARSVKLQLSQFSLYFITTNRTKQANQLAGIFPRQVVMADLMPIQKAAIVGQIAAKHGIQLSYMQSRQLLIATTDNALAPEMFAELLGRERRDQLAAFAGGTITAAELVKIIM